MIPRYSWLWKLYILEFLDSASFFIFDFVFVLYLSSKFAINDIVSGCIYGTFGFVVLIFGLVFGCVIDYFGVELNATRRADAIATILLLCPAATVFSSPVIKLGLRRYTNPSCQETAFRQLYVVTNLASIVAGLVVNYCRIWVKKNCFETAAGTWCHSFLWERFPIFITPITDFTRLVFVFCVLFSVLQLFVSFSLLYSMDRWNLTDRYTFSVQESYRRIFSDVDLKRYLFLCTIVVVGVGCLSRFFGVIFPIYYVRQFGRSASYERILILNPLVIIVITPLCILMNKWFNFSSPYRCLLIGTLVSALSVFCLALSSSIAACVITMVIFSLGEIFWSPKLLELAVNFSHEECDGLMVVFPLFSKFMSRAPAGFLSGYLLNFFFPLDGERYPKLLWTVVGLCSLTTPLLLTQFKEIIFTPKVDLSEHITVEDSALGDAHPAFYKATVDCSDEETKSTMSSSPQQNKTFRQDQSLSRM